jgi:hypothetical protein
MKLRYTLVKEVDSKDLKIRGFNTLPKEQQRKFLLEFMDIELMEECNKLIGQGIPYMSQFVMEVEIKKRIH